MTLSVLRFYPTALTPTMRRGAICAALWLTLPGLARAADTRPVVGPGATRDDAINAYGWPTGQSRLGNKEVLNYPQGSITLADGKVERVDFSTSVPWPAPRPRPGTPVEAAAKRAEARSFDPWTTSFTEAVAQAAKQHAKILAAFVGSDWSPPSKRFLEEVATHPDFVNGLMGDFVFLKLDFPTRIAQPAALKKQNEDLRARSGVTTYPALVVISPGGDPVAVVDLTRESAGDSYRAQVLAAVLEVRDRLKLQPAPAAAAKVVTVTPPPAPAPAAPANGKSAGDGGQRAMVGALISSADWALMLGLGGGALVATALVWLLWRSRTQVGGASGRQPKFAGPKVQLGDVPTLVELHAWPAERVRRLVAALFEAVGYQTQLRETGGDADVELRRAGHVKPNVLVCCRPGSAGPVGPKVVRELLATLVAEGVPAGWIVSADSFSEDARAIAAQRGIELIDGDGAIERLRALESSTLMRVLERAGG